MCVLVADCVSLFRHWIDGKGTGLDNFKINESEVQYFSLYPENVDTREFHHEMTNSCLDM